VLQPIVTISLPLFSGRLAAWIAAHIGPGGNARQDAFLQRQPARGDDRVLIAHRDHVVHDLQVEILRDN
jgi:hypothetical protein